eukprot:GEZU01038812.1.p2 GENE.GEZU01038812.1~~GEZU01038812.1.p2  ORF type:complete len:290 (-),score=108.22 GEZU01038812.1:185-1054(-)
MKGFVRSALLLCAFMLCCSAAIASTLSTPALVWSGNNNNQLSTLSRCSSSSLAAMVSNMAEQQSPKIILVFVHQQLRTEQFMKLAGSFSAHANGGSFSNLKALIESHASMTFGDCKVDEVAFSRALIAALESKDNVVTSVFEDGEFPESFLSTMNMNKVNVVVVKYGAVAENAASAYAHADAKLNEIVAAVNAATSGNYVAIFAADAASKPESPVFHSRLARTPLAFLANNGTGNDTNNYEIFLTPNIMAGIIFGGLFAFILYISISMMANIKTADHLTDLIDLNKKNL